jgi:hypothetical protein
MAKKKLFWTDKEEPDEPVKAYGPEGRDIHIEEILNQPMRTFDTGATRDNDIDKPDFCGFLSPEVIIRFGDYMHEHRFQADGTKRAADNWRKGIPRSVYIESLFRHFIDLWQMHSMELDGDEAGHKEIEDALCAILFNTQGYLYEFLKGN